MEGDDFMSVEIIYGRKFIKVPFANGETRYAVTSISGDSRSYTVGFRGRERREKVFSNWFARISHGLLTEKEVMKCVEDMINGRADDCHMDLGYRSQYTSFTCGQLRKWFERGLKEAETIEEIYENYWVNCFNIYILNPRASYSSLYKEAKYIKTTQELVDAYNNCKPDEYIYLRNSSEDLRRKKPAVPENKSGDFLLKRGSYYVMNYDTTRGSYRMTRLMSEAQKFTFDDALALSKTLWGGYSTSLKIVKFKEPKKSTRYLVELNDYVYYVRKTKYGFSFGSKYSAQRMTKDKADRIADHINRYHGDKYKAQVKEVTETINK